MRTTLTIDDDLAGILKDRARSLGKSFKDVVNTALREGLARESAASVPSYPVKTRPHQFETRPGLDWNRLNQLCDELEVEVTVGKERFERPSE